jgi:predicted RNA binding protein YcfA (HicA-like mRNA interferase family)
MPCILVKVIILLADSPIRWETMLWAFMSAWQALDESIVTIYSYTMGKRDKLLDKARRLPHGLRFEEFERLSRQCGWVFDHQTGSHRIWHSPGRARLSVQVAGNGRAKGYQVRQFLEQLDREVSNEEGLI